METDHFISPPIIFIAPQISLLYHTEPVASEKYKWKMEKYSTEYKVITASECGRQTFHTRRQKSVLSEAETTLL